MYMSAKHGQIEAIFLKLPSPARIPAVYIALCKVGKVRKTAIENRLSAMKLFTGTRAGQAAVAADDEEDENEDEETRERPAPAPAPSRAAAEPPRVGKPARAASVAEPAAPATPAPKKKRTWEEDFEEALKAEDEAEKAEKAEKEKAKKEAAAKDAAGKKKKDDE